MFTVPEKHRVLTGIMKSTKEHGNNGAFYIQGLNVIASDGDEWEHVSVSTHSRCPTWDEMNHIKSKFWGAEDVVIQIHPGKKDHVNNHKYCLHLWRKEGTNDYVEMPPKYMI